jgi:hypothetical protein
MRLTAATFLLCLTLPACYDREADDASAALRDSAGRAIASGSRASLPPLAAAALDSANVAFRAKQYDDALTAYRAAAAAAPMHAAPLYGIYMVAKQQGNAALADSALAAVRVRTPGGGTLTGDEITATHGGAVAPGAATGSTKGSLPAGHPPIAPSLPPGHPPTGTTPKPAPKPGATRGM